MTFPGSSESDTPVRVLPTGTVTFLFTDIEGSTQMLQRLGDAYAEVLLTHQRLLRAAFTAHDGIEVDTQGDSFFIAFPTALDALAAAMDGARALAAQAWPNGERVRVRMGLHSGAPQVVEGRYVGLDVHRAARIASAGYGGQILLSASATELIRVGLPDGVALRDLGEHRLKDLQHAERIYQAVVAGFPADFPPLRALDTRPHNLPTQANAMLGRGEELAAVLALLRRDDVRLVTLTGPGGIGKTRLSLQVGAEALEHFADGVWLVRLARVSDPSQVMGAIAQVFDVRESGATPMSDLVASALRNKQLLLLLDNFEQVTAAASDIAALLAACPAVKALVTSRAPLDLSGEHEYSLRLLATPDLAHLPPLEQLSQYAAVALFIERAQAAQASFTVTNTNAPAVAEICARLDGLPLAIELAAARIKLLPPQTMLHHLERQLVTLTGGARDLDERQRTMRAAIAWSHDLLTVEERALFRRLAVFAGGWTLELAEAVCLAPNGAPPLNLDMLDGLTRLDDHSLIQIREGVGAEATNGPRFSMLHVIQEYALEQLEASGEASALRDAHALALLQFARASQRALMAAPSPQEHLTRVMELKGARDNLRAALHWASGQGDLNTACYLLTTIGDAWNGMDIGTVSEERAIAERLLARIVAANGGDPDRPVSLAILPVSEAWQEAVVRDVRVFVMLYVAGLALTQNDYARAQAVGAQALDWANALGDIPGACAVSAMLGQVALAQGDSEGGIALMEGSNALARQFASPLILSSRLANFAYFLLLNDPDDERALRAAQEALDLDQQAHNPDSESFASLILAMIALAHDDIEQARAYARASLHLSSVTSGFTISLLLMVYAFIAAQQNLPLLAAHLYGAAEAETERRGVALSDREIALYERFLAPAQANGAWAAAYEVGRALSVSEAITEALTL